MWASERTLFESLRSGWALIAIISFASMRVEAKWLPTVALLAGQTPLVSGQNDSAAGPAWVQSEYSNSPAVFPSRK